MRFLERRPGRTAGEERVVLANDDGAPAARGLWFRGRPSGIKPWVDLAVDDHSIIADVVSALGPGASVMIAYQGDETERTLRRRVPPAATPLGIELLKAGCRWFKDWYFPEGGREGFTKLQASVPLDEVRRREGTERLAAELRAFLKEPDSRPEDRRRAEEGLEILQRSS
ncbi:MAG TPA: DUF1122 family protein [Actinomycetota bacterium]|jgi:hypothetical protein|nr:DUF1122 family protein [Actinomycetota bacterium]